MSSGDTRFINHATISDFQRGCSSDLEFGRRGLPNLSREICLPSFFFMERKLVSYQRKQYFVEL